MTPPTIVNAEKRQRGGAPSPKVLHFSSSQPTGVDLRSSLGRVRGDAAGSRGRLAVLAPERPVDIGRKASACETFGHETVG